jgi:adenylosuccinate lyase
MSEAIITELVKRGAGRQEAHELLRQASMKAFEENKHLKETLGNSAEKYLNREDLEKLFDYKNYIGLSVEKTEQVVKKWRG